ncbi:GNAT family N-acetyltransferase [Micromonospora sp. NBC_01796]|uniref:GNAT family N-acetyltransferase n=1 Tax=Micromonospora sp. NBC_01796 TaxID=2975987 RepID=UPI002DD89E98|nr:GNAT family N-acetyltransferase [Micromonospora sp. NBC_01796]WSA85867.1 GNAT family N-acetyltransferase [Micromonospora sp. NBC_01796]
MSTDLIDYGLTDRADRRVTLRPVDDENWRAVADVVPLDEQRAFVAPSAARYLLLSMREGVWRSLAVYADEEVVGHLMWGHDNDDLTYWLGGMLVDAGQQGRGLGRAAVLSLVRWLMERPDCPAVRLSVDQSNVTARRLYASVGFVEQEPDEDGEIVAEIARDVARRPADAV